MDRTITQVEVPSDLARRYNELAEEIGRDRQELLVEALEDYLERAADEARLAAAVAAADRGEVVDAEVVKADAEALLDRVDVPPERRAKIRAEVRAEMEDAVVILDIRHSSRKPS